MVIANNFCDVGNQEISNIYFPYKARKEQNLYAFNVYYLRGIVCFRLAVSEHFTDLDLAQDDSIFIGLFFCVVPVSLLVMSPFFQLINCKGTVPEH
jgi:hypothetical protein